MGVNVTVSFWARKMLISLEMRMKNKTKQATWKFAKQFLLVCYKRTHKWEACIYDNNRVDLVCTSTRPSELLVESLTRRKRQEKNFESQTKLRHWNMLVNKRYFVFINFCWWIITANNNWFNKRNWKIAKKKKNERKEIELLTSLIF